MTKAAQKNKQSTFAAMVADSELEQKTIQVGGHPVTIQELNGRDRFSLAEKADDNRWDTLLWVAFTGLVDPRPDTVDELEKLKSEWVVDIANAVLKISGMAPEDEVEAGNESASVTGIGIS